MRKIIKATAAATALALALVVSMGAPVEAASSSNVTLVNVDTKTTKKSVQSVQITSPAFKSAKLTIYRGTSNVSVQLKTKVTVKGKGITSKTKNYNAVNYKSSSPSVVSVDSKGKITAKKNGTATITVSSAANSKITAKVTITVKSGVGAISAKVNKKSTATVTVGKTAKITTTLSRISSGAKRDVTYTSSNTKVATVSSKGVITAKGAGKATITVAPKYGSGVKATITVTVPEVKPTTMKATKTSATIAVGGTTTVGATFTPSTTTNKGLTFKSSKTSVATVDANGKVTGKAAGDAVITITSKAKTSKGKYLTATVKVKVVGVTLNTKDQVLAKGQTVQVSATTNASSKAFAFTSSNTKVATVDANGKVTAVAPGTAYVTVATKVSPVAKATFKVTVVGLTLNTKDQVLYAGQTAQVSASTTASDKTLVYTSSNTKVATVVNGKITAVGQGTATITVASKAVPAAKATFKVTVNNWSLNVTSDDTVDLVGGSTHAITYAALPTGAKVTFTPDSTDFVNVDAKGVVTAKDGVIGAVTITVKATIGTVSAPTSTVTVRVVPQATRISLAENSNKEFSYTGEIKVKGLKTTFDKINQMISDHKAFIDLAGIQSASKAVVVNGVTYVVAFDATAYKVTITKDGQPVVLTDDEKTINSISIKLPEGETVNSLLATYLLKLESVLKVMPPVGIDLDRTFGTHNITHVGFAKGFMTVTVDNTVYKAFVKDGNFFVVGDITQNPIIAKLVERGILDKPEFVGSK